MKTYNRSQTTQKSPGINATDVCRLCMGVDVTMHDIFDITLNSTTASLASKILTCLSIEVKDNQWFPTKLCAACLKSLDAFTKFRERCHVVNKKLEYLYEKTASCRLACEAVSPLFSTLPLSNQYFDRSQPVQHCSEELNSPGTRTSADLVTDYSNLFIEDQAYFCAVQNSVSGNSEARDLASLDGSVESSNNFLSGPVNDSMLPVVPETSSSDFEEGGDGLELQVSMNGSSYVIEVLEETNEKKVELPEKNFVNDLPKVCSISNADLKTNSLPAKSSVNQCSCCKKVLDNNESLKEHIQKHTKGYFCQICYKWFSCKSGLRRHDKIHSGEKPYKCVRCLRSFSQKEILRRHILTHSRDKPFKCSSCDKCYTQKESLKMHIKNNHLPRVISEINQYQCSLCDKSFCHLSGLSRHQQSHAGIKYPCKSCARVFTDQSCLRRHNQRVHLRENSVGNKPG